MIAEPEGRRAIALLALAGFFSAAAFRVCDPLLPLLAAEFSTSTGAAAYTISSASVGANTAPMLPNAQAKVANAAVRYLP